MNVLHENLSLEVVPKPYPEWREDLRSLVSGYPFERRRRAAWSDPWTPFRKSWTGETTVPTRFVAARYVSRVVGWLQLLDFSHVSGLPPLFLGRWELIQRNRDDLRGALLDAVRNRVGDALLVLEQPTQNRTARRFLRRRSPLESTGHRAVLGGTPDEDQDAPTHIAPLREVGRTDLVPFRGWRDWIRGPVRAALPRRKRRVLLRWRLSGDAPGAHRAGILRSGTETPRGLVVVARVGPGRRIESDMGRVEHLLLAPDADPAAALLPLLRWADSRFARWNLKHREAAVDLENTPEEPFERRGYRVLSRREGFAGPRPDEG